MPETWTIRRVLEWMSRDFADRALSTPRLDAELLVARALGQPRVVLYMDLDRPLAEGELAAVRAMVKRRRAREPIAYIVGEREFWKRAFEVSKAVLVPRPDTEALVSAALALIPNDRDVRVLDLCAGSGILAVTLAAERPRARAIAADLSPEALEIVRRNAAKHGVAERVETRLGDLFGAVGAELPFDLIVSNPPYIPTAEIETLEADVRVHEPRMALDGGADGFDFHRRLVAEAPAFLVPNGSLLVEVGMGQAAALEAALGASGSYEAIHSIQDYGGIARVVAARRHA